jgi:manganese transport protein
MWWRSDIWTQATGRLRSAADRLGYSLLSVILVSNLMAMLLQAAALRLGIVKGLNLPEACRQAFDPRTNLLLWIGCEVAIIACNIAEVLGMACGLGVLFHVPLALGVCITAFDVMLVMRLQQRGVRVFEAFIIGLITLVAICLALQLWWLRPSLSAMAAGVLPSAQIFTRPDMLYLAVGIIGATVMPHNLYLHSALVKSRRHESTSAGVRSAIKYATLDSNVALLLALLVNGAILVLSAAAFHRPGQPPISDLEDAYRLLSPSLGVGPASLLFGVGLIASGLSASITGTLAGQVVMEGFLDMRMPRATRAVLTRAFALVPAMVASVWFGREGVGKLLILSQVILGLQLPFAVMPLLWFTTRRRYLGIFAFRQSTSALLWAVAAALVVINLWVLCHL